MWPDPRKYNERSLFVFPLDHPLRRSAIAGVKPKRAYRKCLAVSICSPIWLVFFLCNFASDIVWTYVSLAFCLSRSLVRSFACVRARALSFFFVYSFFFLNYVAGIEWKWWDRTILCLIFLNTITLALYDPFDIPALTPFSPKRNVMTALDT